MRVDYGGYPSQPTEDSELIENLHHYDWCLVGIIQQGDKKYLMQCVSGEVSDVSVFRYCQFLGDLSFLTDAEDLAQLHRRADHMMHSMGEVTYVLYREDSDKRSGGITDYWTH